MSQVDFDLLSAKMANALKKGEFEKALPMISRLKNSGHEVTPSLIYFEGFGLQNLGRLTEAEAAYRRYMETAGKSGAYYNKALGRIVEIQDQLETMLARYKELLNTKPTKPTESEMSTLEAALGARAAPLKAEKAAAEAERQRKAEVEAARKAADKAERAKGPWELVHRPYGSGRHALEGAALFPDGTITVVGSAHTPKCKKKNNSWLVTLDAAGDVIKDVVHCASRGGYGFHTFFNGIKGLDDGSFITGAVSDSGKLQRAAVYRFGLNFQPMWSSGPSLNATNLPNSFNSVFWQVRSSGPRRVVAAGFTKYDDDFRFGQVTEFDADGRMIWGSTGDSLLTRNYYDAAKLGDGRVVAVGEKTSTGFFSSGKGGAIDIFEPLAPDLPTDDRGIILVPITDEVAVSNDTVVRGVAPTLDNGYVSVGEFRQTSESRAAQAFAWRNGDTTHASWNKAFGRQGGNNRANDIAPDGDGFVVVGAYHSENQKWQGWIFKLDADGNVLWDRKYGGAGEDYLASVTVLPGGGGYIASGAKGGAGWVLKLTNDGRLQ